MPPIRCTNPSSTARLFVQLCARRAGASVPILDILLPPPPSRRSVHQAARTSTARSIAQIALPRTRSSGTASQARRAFSATSAARRTQAIHNPQTDEEGREMVLEITPRAAERLTQIMAKDANPQLALRIQVESGGCHGFQYLMSLTTLPASLSPSSDASSSAQATTTTTPDPAGEGVAPSTTTAATASRQGLGEDDTVFAYVSDGEADGVEDDKAALAASGPKVVLDGPSLELLKGSKVDFTMELIGSQFKIVDNPLATSSCGCGTSFDIKA
ncbi:hypothetical protein F4780DRAFT_755952 [Xylariomycetidae sp. FL0641]|nr:hypothetical protein F4780DRAFT_755952 [Xylariomycetidae sp. FL0641]